jgi:putative sigma-54 modulation protein
MNIEYVARHFDLNDQIREHSEDKLQKVLKFLEEPIEIRVTFERATHGEIVEVHAAHRHGVLQATEEREIMYDALHQAIDKIEKQARRSRKKFMDKRRRADRVTHGAHHWPVEVLEGGSIAGGATPKIIKSSHLHIKPMSIEEAALVLRDSKNDFIVFRGAATDRISVLYKRKDNNFGLITPEIG